MSLDDPSKLETCIRGQIESQSFSLWALVTVFGYLRDANCVPDDAVFSQLVSSMTTAINVSGEGLFFHGGLFTADTT